MSLLGRILIAGTAVTAASCTEQHVLEVTRISPAEGPVTGGTRVTLDGAGFSSDVHVEIGGVECGAVSIDSDQRLSCTTGANGFRDGVADVVVVRDVSAVTLSGAFRYGCPWTTTNGRQSCGAAPPHVLAMDTVESFVTEMQAGHGFVSNVDGGGTSNLDDTTSFSRGDRSAYVETDGAGTPRTLARLGGPAVDMRGQMIKLWLRVENVASAAAIDLRLGDSGLQNYFRFRLRSVQGQQWMTDGDWVAFTVSWAPDNVTVVGTPDRSAITDISFRVVDDAAGSKVCLHVNGLALVPEPVDRYPAGVVTFTFDDDHDDMVGRAAPLLRAHDFTASAFVIVDTVGTAKHASVEELLGLQGEGWDVGAHAFTGVHHDARFPTLPLDVVEDDLVNSRAWLMSKGFTAYDHCAYPGGDFTNGGQNVLPLASRYFTSCRTIFERQRESYPPADLAKLRVFYVTNAATLESAKLAVDYARKNREWLIFVFHKLVDADPTVATEWPASSFTALVEHVAASGMPVRPISSVLD
jgi:peptidoglycan/xylan/chitin deacetylase (PgdA/CDA1 family)